MNFLALFVSLIGGLIISIVSPFLGISNEISLVLGLQTLIFIYFMLELDELKLNSIKRNKKTKRWFKKLN